MKKLISIALLLSLVCLLFSCTPGKAGDADTTESDTTPAVTSPEGFEDVTAPPESTTSPDTEADTTVADTTAAVNTKITSADEAIEAARAWLGESDPDTGYKYAYSYDGSMIENEVPYFKIRVSWYIEEQERYSLCGYLLVSPDGEISKYSW